MKKTLTNLIALLLLLVTAWPGFAQETSYTSAQLDELLQTVALYPDPLLAQVLPASAYPAEIEAAAAWLANGGKQEDIDSQPWDDSVKALARYPDVLQKMAADPEWTAALGEAFAHQMSDVTASLQRLRRQAYNNGALKSGEQQRVSDDAGYLTIVPSSPGELYVPSYDPYDAYYGQSPLINFGMAYSTGPWLSYGFDWLGTSCFRYPVGTYWGRGSNLYGRLGYCGVNYVHNIYNVRNNCDWRVDRQRYQSCRPTRRTAQYQNYAPQWNGGTVRSWSQNNNSGWRGQRSGWRGNYNPGYTQGHYNPGFTQGYSRHNNSGYTQGNWSGSNNSGWRGNGYSRNTNRAYTQGNWSGSNNSGWRSSRRNANPGYTQPNWNNNVPSYTPRPRSNYSRPSYSESNSGRRSRGGDSSSSWQTRTPRSTYSNDGGGSRRTRSNSVFNPGGSMNPPMQAPAVRNWEGRSRGPR